MKNYQVLARRYRPQKFSQLIGQEAVITTLKNALRQNKVAGAYLFCGSRGVGKTSLARLFAKALSCEALDEALEPCGSCTACREITAGQSLDIIEIDGASHRGIEDVRQITETVGYAPASGKYKIYIIDEVHMLTKEAFNALLKTLEEPPEKAKFFFATTEPHKVLPTILSRCQRFDLERLKNSEITDKLREIAEELKVTIEEEALLLIAKFSEGSLRDAESLLDQTLCFAQKEVRESDVRALLGLVSQEDFLALDQAFSQGNLPFAFELVEKVYSSGKDLSHFFKMLIEHYRNHAFLKLSNHPQGSNHYTKEEALYALQYLLEKESSFTKTRFPQISLEATLLHLLKSKERVPVEVLVQRLSELEESLKQEENKAAPLVAALPPPPLPPQKEVKKEEIKTAPPQESPPKKEALVEVPFSPFEQPVDEKKDEETKNEEKKGPKKHLSHYDTLIRFAQIELEGTLIT